MIYVFRVVSDEVSNFRREIQIDADATFLDLRNAICECTGYEKALLSSFFTCDDDWDREQEISLEDMGSDSSQDVYLMEDTPISDFIEDEGQKLQWVFDYFTNRAFFLELKRAEPGKHLKDALCSVSVGEAPAQLVNLNEFDAKMDETADKISKGLVDPVDLGEDFYGSTGYNDDEFDAAGFDELSMDD